MEHKQRHIYVCEDSIEGIFTGIYQAWSSGYGHANNYIQLKEEQELQLFSTYIEVTPDSTLSMKVTNSIRKKIGIQAYRLVYYMLLSNHKEKADLCYRFMILGFHHGPSVVDYLSNESVSAMSKNYKTVSMEAHKYKGFLRFEQLEQGFLCGKMRPNHNIVTLVAPHFSDRLSRENFMIVDEGRGIAVVHPAGKEWFLVALQGHEMERLSMQIAQEEEMKRVWNCFVTSISIKERENLKLQQNLCPLRYREFMPEFGRES